MMTQCSDAEKLRIESTSKSTFVFRATIFMILTLQATCYFLLVGYSRRRDREMYFSSTVVFMSENVKLLVSLLVIFSKRKTVADFVPFLCQSLFTNPLEIAKLTVPALLYTLQNNLLYVAMSHLDVVTFQITNQLKIPSAALLSVFILHRHLKLLQWVSLLLLFTGVSIVQVETHYTVTMETTVFMSSAHQQSPFVGLAAIMSACATSGFAGVYLEKLLQTEKTPFWVRNVQMYILGVLLGILGMAFKDGIGILDKGFFFGYDTVVWLIVCFASAGGILVSLILKYANTVTKGFATSCAIVLSSFVSVHLFGFLPSKMFVLGGTFVISAVLLYGF